MLSVAFPARAVATIQGNVLGTWVSGVKPAAGGNSFAIYLNQTVAADTDVAWFVVN